MPIRFDLESIRTDNKCDVYFETGMYDPQRENASLKQALKCNFKKLFSIEILSKWVTLAAKEFKEELSSGRLTIFKGDSSNLKQYISHCEENKTIFFLDAHVDNKNIFGTKKKCPLLDELEAIKSLARDDHVLLIDDLRILRKRCPWGEVNQGQRSFLDLIKKKVLEINPNYKISTLPGHIENDVLYVRV